MEKQKSNINITGRYRYLIVISVLFLIIGFLGFSFYNYIAESESRQLESENLRILKLEEENNLRSELDEIIEQYDNIRDELDNLNIDLGDKQSEIDNLKSEIRDLLNTKQDLKLAREKIQTLQDISKRYFAQVDSLLGTTEQQKEMIDNLTLENEEIINKNEDLNQENTDLNARLDLGSSLKVFDVEIFKIKFGTHGQERSVKKAKNIQVIRVCFKISENLIAQDGDKSVYIQYISSSNKLLRSASTPSGSSFMIGDSLSQATTYSNFNYTNQEIDLCCDWQRGDILEKGQYKVRFYIEGKLSGEFIFKLN